MLFTRWLKSIGLYSHARLIKFMFGKRLPTQSVSRGQCLASEFLEDRTVPSTFSQNYVTQVYTDLLHRAVDPGGLSSWSALIDAGTPLNQIIMDIESSPEYMDDQINQMFETYLNRPADPGALSAWSPLLASQSVEQVEAEIIGSPEFYSDAGGSIKVF